MGPIMFQISSLPLSATLRHSALDEQARIGQRVQLLEFGREVKNQQ